MNYPKSETTLKKHNYIYKGIQYKNDLGSPCEYRVIKEGKDTGRIIKYYKNSFLTEYNLIK